MIARDPRGRNDGGVPAAAEGYMVARMRTGGTVTACLVASGVLLLSGGPAARGEMSQSRTILVRLDGTWGPPVPGRVAAADLDVELEKRTERFQVEEARVLSGGRSGSDVLTEAQGRRPAFRLRGPREVLAPLAEARPGQAVELTGYLRAGSAELSLSGAVVKADGR
jgi:hypothetical protein